MTAVTTLVVEGFLVGKMKVMLGTARSGQTHQRYQFPYTGVVEVILVPDVRVAASLESPLSFFLCSSSPVAVICSPMITFSLQIASNESKLAALEGLEHRQVKPNEFPCFDHPDGGGEEKRSLSPNHLPIQIIRT
ncbi:unnamed protein product [Lactuca virosa]|uniref:Uncharacterized protein n=1 Tax=Lactuca virosa TaxID=75947 RepID=A0AAU9M9G6_9ASTR|nr:unnamed protein product [Lactuca virosa]